MASSPTGTYQCNDGEWRPLEIFLRETHEAWLPFCNDEDISTTKDIAVLQSAWCNCKVPLLEYFKPMVGGLLYPYRDRSFPASDSERHCGSGRLRSGRSVWQI